MKFFDTRACVVCCNVIQMFMVQSCRYGSVRGSVPGACSCVCSEGWTTSGTGAACATPTTPSPQASTKGEWHATSLLTCSSLQRKCPMDFGLSFTRN